MTDDSFLLLLPIFLHNTKWLVRRGFLRSEESLDIFEEERLGSPYMYRLVLYANCVSNAGTSDDVDVYVVKKNYGNNFEAKEESYDGISSTMGGAWFYSDYWYCDQDMFKDGTSSDYGVIICNNGKMPCSFKMSRYIKTASKRTWHFSIIANNNTIV